MSSSKYWRFIEFVKAHPEFEWNIYCLSANPSITRKDVISHPEMGWDINGLSQNPSITMKDVLGYPEMAWSSGTCTSGSIWMVGSLSRAPVSLTRS
jgi:hypothetical protein